MVGGKGVDCPHFQLLDVDPKEVEGRPFEVDGTKVSEFEDSFVCVKANGEESMLKKGYC
jgi:hypothetical protein